VRSHRPKVVFWYAATDPYMIDRFNALHSSRALEFECWFSELREYGRSWDVSSEQLDFPHRFLPTTGRGRWRTAVPFAAMVSVRPDILVSFHGNPLVALSYTQALRPGGKLVFYVEKTFDTWVRRSVPKELAKQVLLRTADAFLTPGLDADTYVRKYARAPIYRLNHVVDVQRFQAATELRLSSASKARRRELGLEGFVFLNVGRIWFHKGIETLINAFANIEEAGIDASLLLVGDGVDRERYMEAVRRRGLRRIRFLDFVQPDGITEIYALADAFVFPTRGDPYGLVVDEAMASGLPVIASHSAGEIRSRIIDGRNGYLVPVDGERDLNHKMLALLENPDVARQMGDQGKQMISSRDMEHWVRQIEIAIEGITQDVATGPSIWTSRRNRS
jgi:glycosyltransferase involved in cell wall biosynthesis